MELFGAQRYPRQQGLLQVGEVPICVPWRSDALIHLEHMYLLPRDLFTGQFTQHSPGSTTSADRHVEATACDDSIPCFRGKDGGSLFGNCVSVGKNFNFHDCASVTNWGGTAHRYVVVVGGAHPTLFVQRRGPHGFQTERFICR